MDYLKKLVAGLFLFSLSSFVLGHGGGLDKQGGHHDRKHGGYHCHKGPCNSIHRKTSEATKEAIQSSRPISLVYRRNDWKHWSDFDGDCMNTRHEMLKSQADGPVKVSPNGCYISTGFWNDPFSGKSFTRASDLDVDHIIPLKWAHSHGSANWSKRKKEQFANDPSNLLVVDDGLNQQKGAKGPTEWLPPNKSFRCQYLRSWQSLLEKYTSIKMTISEQRIFNRQIKECSR